MRLLAMSGWRRLAKNEGSRGARARSPNVRVRVLIYKAKEGGYWAQVPALPGCVSEGETRQELIANLREALEGCLLTPGGDFVPEQGGKEEEIDV